MPNHTPRSRPLLVRHSVALALSLIVLAASAAPAWALAGYPDNYNPLLVISDFNWRNSASMSYAEIQAFLNTQPGPLKDYSCAEGGPRGLHSTVVKPAALIIAEAAQYWNVNPKLIIATLNKEQSLISAANHDGYGGDMWGDGGVYPPPPGVTLGSGYHLKYAMGVGCYVNADGTVTDPHPGFGDQVWTGAEKLAAAPSEGSTSPYRWWPGKVKRVWSYPDAAYIDIVPLNQPTWNFYTYTPYYPQYSVWREYNRYFGDPRIDAVDGRIHRFYNKRNGSHFYTASAPEAQRVARDLSATYVLEGAAYSLDTTPHVNAQPLFRFYRPGNSSHFYTVSAEERDRVIRLLSKTYKYEGTAYFVSLDPARTPVYRFYDRAGGSHFYTMDPDEREVVINQLGWKYTFEGIAYYVALAQ